MVDLKRDAVVQIDEKTKEQLIAAAERGAMLSPHKKYFTEEEVAIIFSRSAAFIKRCRLKGEIPCAIQDGRNVLYEPSDLDAIKTFMMEKYGPKTTAVRQTQEAIQ